ncbi:MAG TPA: hypothetical protein VJV74_01285 [Terriglobia bacterium]|nr:hypothetical protein [Terriglobia bacterium]
MRSWKRHLLLGLMLLVTLSYAVREVPELLSLQDDVSNDGDVVEAHQAGHVAAPADDHQPPAPPRISPLADLRPSPSPAPVFALRQEAGRSLLYLISLQRE